MFDELGNTELEALRAAGLEETPFSEKNAQQLERLWAEGVWEVAEQISKADVQKVRAVALEADLTY